MRITVPNEKPVRIYVPRPMPKPVEQPIRVPLWPVRVPELVPTKQ